jgi:hypothetical protein
MFFELFWVFEIFHNNMRERGRGATWLNATEKQQ